MCRNEDLKWTRNFSTSISQIRLLLVYAKFNLAQNIKGRLCILIPVRQFDLYIQIIHVGLFLLLGLKIPLIVLSADDSLDLDPFPVRMVWHS